MARTTKAPPQRENGSEAGLKRAICAITAQQPQVVPSVRVTSNIPRPWAPPSVQATRVLLGGGNYKRNAEYKIVGECHVLEKRDNPPGFGRRLRQFRKRPTATAYRIQLLVRPLAQRRECA